MSSMTRYFHTIDYYSKSHYILIIHVPDCEILLVELKLSPKSGAKNDNIHEYKYYKNV